MQSMEVHLQWNPLRGGGEVLELGVLPNLSVSMSAWMHHYSEGHTSKQSVRNLCQGQMKTYEVQHQSLQDVNTLGRKDVCFAHRNFCSNLELRYQGLSRLIQGL